MYTIITKMVYEVIEMDKAPSKGKRGGQIEHRVQNANIPMYKI